VLARYSLSHYFLLAAFLVSFLIILSGMGRQKTRIPIKRKSGERSSEVMPFLPPQMEYLSLL